MSMSGKEIRILRQRLGWSLAEMARQMGGSVELVNSWETNAAQPDSESLNQLKYLKDYVDLNSDYISNTPAVEIEIAERGLAQLTYRDLLK